LAVEVRVVVVFAVVTVCATENEPLAASFVSPAYCAVRVWLPTVSEVVCRLAVPFASVPVPRDTDPSLKVTVPVAVPGETVAVKVTDWPNIEGLPEVVSDVVVAVGLTDCVKGDDVLPASFVSPP
jgi:hypothetical protein